MIETKEGYKLHIENWLVDNAKASLILIHGLGEYAGRYKHVAAALNDLGVNVYSFDLRGHGHSEGPKAFIKDIKEYRNDLEIIYQNVPKDLPLFMLGHSLGGLIVTDFVLGKERKELQGVVLSAPALEVGDDITLAKQKLIRILNFISPKLRTVKLDPKSISRDKKEVEKYESDPLIFHEKGKAGLGVALLNAISDVKTKFKDFHYPVLIMHGGADQLTNKEGSKSLYNKAASSDKTLKIWNNAYHEIFNELNKTEIIKKMADWLNSRI